MHTYQAFFVGTTAAPGAISPTQSVTVTGTYPSITTLTATGNPGSYTLTSTVVGQGVSALTPGGSVSIIDQTNSNAVVGTATLGTGTPAQTLVAATGSPLTTGTAPYAVATGDFNGDGFTDFAVENYNSGTVSVFLGNGDGTFKPQVTYSVGTAAGGHRRSRCKRRWEARPGSDQHRQTTRLAFCSAMAMGPFRRRSPTQPTSDPPASSSPTSIMTESSISLPPTSTARTSASCWAMAMAPSRHKLLIPSVMNPAR